RSPSRRRRRAVPRARPWLGVVRRRRSDRAARRRPWPRAARARQGHAPRRRAGARSSRGRRRRLRRPRGRGRSRRCGVADRRAGRDRRRRVRSGVRVAGRPAVAGGGARVTSRARVGIVGCGVISHAYAENAAAFDRFEIVACADRDPLRSEALAAAHGLASTTVDDLLAREDLGRVLKLTPPSVHADVTRAALGSGKHVSSEKPLAMSAAASAELLDLADRTGLRVGCAPDVFLGGAFQEARSLIDSGSIGRPLGVSATMLAGGQEAWHPDPGIFFRDGAGPLLDMGPYYLTAIVALLGPIVRVAGLSTTFVAERTIEIGPRRGERVPAGTPTPPTAPVRLRDG